MNRTHDDPILTIITPSFNQAHYLEETILSVLSEKNLPIEYLVYDGGSSDGSLDILKKYSDQIDHWESCPDRGQAHAINKGLLRARGTLVTWINSDDKFLPGVLGSVLKRHRSDPNKIILGDCLWVFEELKLWCDFEQSAVDFNSMVRSSSGRLRWCQPGTFVPKSAIEQAGILDEKLRYVFDRDWMCRLLRVTSVTYIHQKSTQFRFHNQSKTVGESSKWLHEQIETTSRYIAEVPEANLKLERAYLALVFGSLPYLSVLRNRRDRVQALRYVQWAVREHLGIAFHPLTLAVIVLSIMPTWITWIVTYAKFRLRKSP